MFPIYTTKVLLLCLHYLSMLNLLLVRIYPYRSRMYYWTTTLGVRKQWKSTSIPCVYLTGYATHLERCLPLEKWKLALMKCFVVSSIYIGSGAKTGLLDILLHFVSYPNEFWWGCRFVHTYDLESKFLCHNWHKISLTNFWLQISGSPNRTWQYQVNQKWSY